MSDIYGTAGDDYLVGDESDQVIYGEAGSDVLDGRGGWDSLLGGDGSDTYVFGYGSGTDFVFNYDSQSDLTTDRILLAPGVNPSDVELSVVTVDHRGMTIPASLLLKLRSTGETLMVRENFESVSGPTQSAIDFIEFADGTTWNRSDIRQLAGYGSLVLTGTPGDDVLLGGDDNEVLDGGAGNDVLAGNGGSDAYVFGQGSGHDTIHNYEPVGMISPDRILLKPEVSAADVELRLVTVDINGNGILPSLQLRLKSTGETLTVRDHFDPAVLGEAAITTIEFADGTVWDGTEIERRVHLFEGTAGDDWLIASDGDDVLDGGAGNDQLMGGLGSDTYAFGYGSGHDLILDQEFPGATASDRILLKPGVTAADVELRITTMDTNGNSLLPSLQLRLKSTGETMIVMGQFLLDAYGELGITTIEFADGTVWDQAEIDRRVHLFEGTAGDDVVGATDGDDVLDGGAGNDQLAGGPGSDTYVFGYGSGHDTVHNHQPVGTGWNDRILLKPEVTTADVELRIVNGDTSGFGFLPSLQLKLKSTGETVTVIGHFESTEWGSGAIGTIEFADGTVWDGAEIERRVHLFEGTAGDDMIMATEGDDVLDGGAGNDQLFGHLGSDTYAFGYGYGHDQIHNHEPQGMTSPDRILLKPEVAVADVELRVVTVDASGNSIPPSLRLTLKSTGETVTVWGHFDPSVWGEAAITTIEFADGTVWDQAEIERRAHLFEGTAGDDMLMASEGNDVLDGGAGNDQLFGNLGSDTYVFGQGSGHDQIHNHEPQGMTSPDRILLKPEVMVADVELRAVTVDASGNSIPPSLRLTLKSTGETATVWGHFDPNVWGEAAITTIEFADGTVWDQAEIERRAHLFEGTAADDVLMATAGNDVLDGGAGNDMLFGNLGSDTYVFGQGYGHDVIHDHEPPGLTSSDRILLKPEVMPADVELRIVTVDATGWSIPPSLQLRLRSTGETLTVWDHFVPMEFGETAITTIEFADGTVWDQAEIERRVHLFEGTAGDDQILGSDGSDVIDGGAGNDELMGGLGGDTYVFGQGYGHDLINSHEPQGQALNDRILLKADVTVADVELRVVAVHPDGWQMPPSLQLRLLSTGETLTVWDYFGDGAWGGAAAITTIEFADGTVWDQAEIERRIHLFEGSSGDDVILATEGDDVLDGGAGNDQLSGGLGADTYVFGHGSGHDLINNSEAAGLTSNDRILLKSGVHVADVELKVVMVEAYGGILPSLQLKLKSTGETMTVLGHFDPAVSGEAAITTIEFADGTVWDDSQIRARANYILGTSGNDTLNGGVGNDYIDGGAGRDTMRGGLGDDVYIVERSTDSVSESSNAGIDTVQSSVTYTLGSNVENLVLTGSGAINGTGNALQNILTGNVAANVLSGGGGHDVLDGGAGNDTLIGGSGNDTYWLARGAGRDTVQESDSTSGNTDVAQFGAGIATDQLWFRRTSNHLEVSVIGTSDAFVIKDWYLGSRYRVEEFKTADGQTLLDNHVQNLVQAMASFAPPAAGQTTLPESYATALNGVIAANWQ